MFEKLKSKVAASLCSIVAALAIGGCSAMLSSSVKYSRIDEGKCGFAVERGERTKLRQMIAYHTCPKKYIVVSEDNPDKGVRTAFFSEKQDGESTGYSLDAFYDGPGRSKCLENVYPYCTEEQRKDAKGLFEELRQELMFDSYMKLWEEGEDDLTPVGSKGQDNKVIML